MWYSIGILMKSCGLNIKEKNEKIFKEIIYLVDSFSIEDAAEKAIAVAKGTHISSDRSNKNLPEWEFYSITDTFELFSDKIVDGTEVFSRLLTEDQCQLLISEDRSPMEPFREIELCGWYAAEVLIKSYLIKSGKKKKGIYDEIIYLIKANSYIEAKEKTEKIARKNEEGSYIGLKGDTIKWEFHSIVKVSAVSCIKPGDKSKLFSKLMTDETAKALI